jgi:hypothetical protein
MAVPWCRVTEIASLFSILLNCHRDYAVYRLYVKRQQKKIWDVSSQTNNKHVFGVGEEK